MTTRTYSFPPSTLKDRISGRVKHGRKPRPDPYLTEVKEKKLTDYLGRIASVGYDRTKSEVIRILKQMLEKKGRMHEHFYGEGGWLIVTKQHPEISSCSTTLFHV